MSGPDTDIPGGEAARREPKDSRPWLAMIAHAEKEMRDYQDRCDNIEKRYANLERLAAIERTREFQMFWANIQVVGPSIYARPPVPVVVPRFKDRSAVKRKASELLERSTSVAFDLEDVDAVMRLIRDNLTVVGRGVPWLWHQPAKKGEPPRVRIEHVHRRDFLHEIARNWREVGWVAKRSWMTKREMKDRFAKDSGDAYETAAFETRKDENDAGDQRLKAPVWEVWHKREDRVVWVAEGVEVLLDDGDPHMRLEGFFPCPRPAYSTVQPGSLIPVPDMMLYKDQLEEINELTARISALSEAIRVRGFYPGGAGEVADAIERAMRDLSDNAVLVPITNMTQLGTGSLKDQLIWLPLDQIVKANRELLDQRRQLIEDVYQITGLSDIMRGATEASETATAQQIKSGYASVRIRDRTEELVRVARDIVRLAAEIMAEHFDGKTLLDMAQLEMPTDAEVERQIKAIVDEAKRMAADPAVRQRLEADPQAAQQAMQEVEGQIEALRNEVTIDAVMKLLRDQRLRPFVLDVETDSTIAPDENAQKQRATEYLTAMGALLAQAMPVLQQFPQVAPLVGDTIRFAQKQFRVGREMDETVEEFVEQMKRLGQQPPQDPNAGQAEAVKAKAEADMQAMQAESAMRQQEQAAKLQAETARTQQELAGKAEVERRAGERAQIEGQARLMEIEATQRLEADRHGREMQAREIDLALKRLDLQLKEVTAASSVQTAALKAEGEAQKVAEAA